MDDGRTGEAVRSCHADPIDQPSRLCPMAPPPVGDGEAAAPCCARHRRQSTVGAPDAGDLTIASGYSGREEVVGAIRNLLRDADAEGLSLSDIAAELSEADIARYLEIADEPYSDLVIRTSGEQRLSDFLLWQAVDSELFFVDAYWPAFRQIDLLRALRSYTRRRQ